MPGNDKKWDLAAERDLCVAVIAGNQDCERPRHNWPKIHNFMNNLGYGFTKEAISQHYTKVIMKDFKSRHGDGSSPTALAKPAASTAKKATPASTKKRGYGGDDDDDAASDVDRKPTKAKLAKLANSDDKPAKAEDKRSNRERSATILDNEARFQEWLTQPEDK